MKLVSVLLLALPVLAQQDNTSQGAAPADHEFTGSVDFGYRSLLTRSGNLESYRTVVNLGEGPKLFDADLRLTPSYTKLFEEASLLMRNWGGEPYSTVRAELRKSNRYNFQADYRTFAHYNYLPSFGNPLLGTGSLLNQSAFDSRWRSTDLRLDLFPSACISPYFTYSRNREDGGGVWVFTRQGNEYPVPTILDYANDNYLGGVSLRFGKLSILLEQGGTRFRDDQASDESIGNRGNLRRPYLGRELRLTDLNEQYRVRGDSLYTRGSIATSPAPWLDVSAVFTYTNPNVDVEYENRSQGTFVVQYTLADASGGADRLTGTARMPRPSGSVNVELRPWNQIRMVSSYMTDRFHNSASAQFLEQYLTGSSTSSFTRTGLDRLVTNDSRQQLDAFFDISSSLTLRGGYRYQWGDASVRSSSFLTSPFEEGRLSRHTGIAGISYRKPSFRLTADFEGASTSQAYFRTSLRDYRKVRTQVRYIAPSGSWRTSFDYFWLQNNNPDRAVRWAFESHAATASVEWFPNSGKRYSFIADYTRSGVHSRIDIIAPQSLLPERSSFREAGNSATLLIRLQPSAWHPRQPGISLGGTLYLNNGSRPTNYYVPQARMSLPLTGRFSANAEWRWYSMTESLYRFENFASHQLLLSLTIRR
jgi:hypothetical protein